MREYHGDLLLFYCHFIIHRHVYVEGLLFISLPPHTELMPQALCRNPALGLLLGTSLCIVSAPKHKTRHIPLILILIAMPVGPKINISPSPPPPDGSRLPVPCVSLAHLHCCRLPHPPTTLLGRKGCPVFICPMTNHVPHHRV